MDVILVAFGPKAATRQALRRLRRLPQVDRVWVVPANERSRRSVEAVAPDDAVAECGTRGVRSIAATLGDQAVLLIHDDAAITAAGVGAMMSALDCGADLVAPHSNEVGTPQFCGSLPPAADALPVLDRVAGLGERRRIRSVRHSCMLGRADTIAALGGTVVIPGGSVVRSDLDIAMVPVAVAHDLSCHHRLAEIGDGPPVLVASMIVRDEEQQIAGALESVAGLVDRVDICDTGSVDDTVAIATSMGAEVRQVEWRDDFGWARNQALEMSRDADFFLHIDADERVVLDDPVLFRRWLRTWRDELDGVLIDLHNHRGAGMSASTHRALRIARTSGSQWSGALHEAVVFEREGGERRVVFYEGLRIDHYGYSRQVVAAKGKADRNISIARAAYEAGPDVKTTIDYARSLRMADEADELSDRLFREALAQASDQTPITVRSYLLAVVASGDMRAGRVDEALESARRAFDLVPREDVALATLGHGLSLRADWHGLVDLGEALGARPSATPMFVVEANIARFHAYLGRAHAELGNRKAALDSLVVALDTDANAAAQVCSDAVPALAALGVTAEEVGSLLATDSTGLIVSALAATVPPVFTAEAVLMALTAGASAPGLFATGLAASLIRPDSDLPDRFLPFAEQATGGQRQGLAAMARRKGRDDMAEVLVPSTWSLTLT